MCHSSCSVEPHGHRETEVLHSPPCPEHNMASVGCAQCPIHLRYCVFMMNLVGHDPTVGERNLCSACDYIFLISILK